MAQTPKTLFITQHSGPPRPSPTEADSLVNPIRTLIDTGRLLYAPDPVHGEGGRSVSVEIRPTLRSGE